MTPKIVALTPEHAAQQAQDFSLVFFVRRTLADVWRLACQADWGSKFETFFLELGGWASNLAIRDGQLWAMLGHWRDGRHDLIHVAMVVPDPWDGDRTDWPADTPVIIESTSPDGVRIKPLAERLRSYRGRTIIVPLLFPPALDKISLDTTRATEEGWCPAPFTKWLKRVEGLGYDTVGLVGVLLNWGLDKPGAYFCSELVAAALIELGLLEEWNSRLRAGNLSTIEARPNFFEPSELARSHILNWEKALTVNSGRIPDGV